MQDTNKKYYWLKLHDDFFTSKRIKKLRKLGSDFVIIYLKMQLLSLKNNGMLEFSGIEDDFASEIALDIDEDADKVQLTISYLQSCGLLLVNDTAEIFLPYVEKLTGASAQDEHTKESTRLRVQKFRERQKALEEKRYSNVTCNGEIDIEKEIDKEKDIMSDSITEIVTYLNQVCGTHYKTSSEKTRSHIKARLREKYTVEDFKTVIDKKNAEWRNDAKMQQFLRPETLFGTKFESYINQPKPKAKNQFNEMIHTDYDFDELEKELLR